MKGEGSLHDIDDGWGAARCEVINIRDLGLELRAYYCLLILGSEVNYICL